ncbi:MAG TPA: hypothetical protein PKH07_05100, partial [bacterium]|nr:hypothetical protein [bacterium]
VSSTILLFVNKVEPFTAITMKAFYYVIPHLELFDLSRKVVHVWQPVPAWVLFGLSAYAAVYVILPLTFASLIFSRKSL